MPITFSGFWHAAAIDVIDKDEVFDANTQFCEVIFSKSLKTDCLISIFQ